MYFPSELAGTESLLPPEIHVRIKPEQEHPLRDLGHQLGYTLTYRAPAASGPCNNVRDQQSRPYRQEQGRKNRTCKKYNIQT
jgi:hypothetical protein